MYAEPAGSFGSAAAAFPERPEDHMGLEPGDRRRKVALRPSRRCGVDRLRRDGQEVQVGCRDRIATRKDHGALDRILEFPNVSWPRIGQQARRGAAGESLGGSAACRRKYSASGTISASLSRKGERWIGTTFNR